MSGVFTIAASAPFARHLAQGLIARVGGDPLALAAATIYLPTRRAARGFGEAFAAELGGAALLPQFKALGDSDEDDLLFDTASDDVELPPAIAPIRRRLLLAHLIRRWDRRAGEAALSFAQAAALAQSLAGVMDEVETQGCDLSRLKDMLPAGLAEHWQGVTHFLDLLSTEWPKILEAEGARNPAARRNQALAALAARLQAQPPAGLVIAAGSTGSVPATAGLLKAIARLPRGAVVLPGLDRALDEASWTGLDPGHPQFGMAQLLQRLECPRALVEDWHAPAPDAARETLLRETLRPAPTTDAWRALAPETLAGGFDGLSLADCADPAQEALAIALALRESLETPGLSAALVTPDRNLARRVASEMTRWGVAIDDSAGRPLAHMAAGAFLCLVAEAAEARFAPVPLLALLKHPFATLGGDAADFRAQARRLDRWCLRGPRPDPGLDGIGAAIAAAMAEERAPSGLAAVAAWWSAVATILCPLETLYRRDMVPLAALREAHAATAIALACRDGEACPLWQGRDGEVAYALMGEMELAAQGLPEIEPSSYAALFRSLAMQTPVRGGFGRHPRLFILGPLEARLQSFGRVVLGGLNEGTWPASAGDDPWFSRPMRAELGLEQPERGIGLSAHDFAMLASGPDVVMTRARKADGAPTIASRWLQRLEQLAGGLGLAQELKPRQDYAAIAAQLVTVAQGERLARPAPTPPVSARPPQLSVTEIETWLRDPYAIYARHVLKLRPLDPLDQPVGAQERGIALHAALEEFVRRHPHDLPDDAETELAGLAEDIFRRHRIPKAALALWRPRFLSAARGVIAVERARRGAIAWPHVEVKGRLAVPAPEGEFVLTGVADRIDVLTGGGCAIIDYKSGNPPSLKQVTELLSPQLPLEAAILAAGGFEGLQAHRTEELIYISLASEAKAREPRLIADAQALAAEAAARLAQRVARFAVEATPYYPRVRPFKTDSVGDYDHLARVREWSAVAEEG